MIMLPITGSKRSRKNREGDKLSSQIKRFIQSEGSGRYTEELLSVGVLVDALEEGRADFG